MAVYHVLATKFTLFQLKAADDVLGELLYKNWYSVKATIQLLQQPAIQIAPKGFWSTRIEFRQQEKLWASCKMSWDTSIDIHTFFGASEQVIQFEAKGIFKNSYELRDQQGQLLMTLLPDFSWTKIKYEYHIHTEPLFDTYEQQPMLLLMMVHCANYYMAMMASSATAV